MDVKTTCLGVLAMGEASGYEIRKHFEEGPFSHFAEGGFGSIYPALTRLTADGLVSCTEMAQDKRPDKKIYTLTDAGFAALKETLRREPAEDRYKSDLLFMLFFADHMAPERAAELIDARIAWYRETLARMAECAHGDAATDGPAGPRFVHGFGVAVYEAALAYLETHKAALVAEIAGRRGAGRSAAE